MLLISISKFYKYLSFLLYLCLLICSGWADNSRMLYDDSEVAVIEITIDPAALEWIYLEENWHSDSLHVATVHFKNALIDETIDSVGFRLRGNTSRDSKKKSFKLSFNTFKPGRQFYDVDKINLNGEHNDPSIIRSKLCWDLFREIGLTASRAAHAAVYINGDYYGLYISVEHIDDEFLQNHFDDDSGNLWKCLYPADLTYRGSEPADYHPYYDDTRPYELKTNKDEYDYSQLARLIDIINNTPDHLFADSLESIIVVAEVLKYLAVNVLVGSWDDYWALMNNYYLYYEPAKDIFHWIPYDYDNTFGVSWVDIDWATVDPYTFGKVVEGPRPLAERIMINPQYHNLYTHFLNFYREKVYRLIHWESRLDSLKEMIVPWAEEDEYRTLDYGFTTEDFHNSYSASGFSKYHVKNGIKEFVNLRCQYLLGQLNWMDSKPVVYALDWQPKQPQADDSIYVTASAYSYYGIAEMIIQFHPACYAVTEEYQMVFEPLEGTKWVEDADRWVGVIPPLEEIGWGKFNIYAEDTKGKYTLYPGSKPVLIRVCGQDEKGIVINEFLAKNDQTNADAAGEYDDWIEIFNPTDSEVLLSGMYLTDDPDNLTRWSFPEDITIGIGEYVLIWCDDDPEQQGLHANFKLAAGGEYIGLVASDGVTIIDSITFYQQTADISYGRYPDGAANWETMTPSPAGSNLSTGIEKNHFPHIFDLKTYPNPFNSSTTVQYRLSERSRVTIEIFNISGQKVWTKTESLKTAGMHKISWQASNQNGLPLGSGVYLLQIRAGAHKQTKKLLLVK